MKIIMKNMKYLLCLVLLGVSTMARADLKTTTRTVMGEGSRDDMTLGASTFTRYVRAGAERSETSIAMGAMKINTVALHICDPSQDVQLDPNLKIYALLPQDNAASAGARTHGDATAKDEKTKDEKTTGKVVITYGVKDLGEAIVAGWNTRHYLVASHMERSGCIGDGATDSKTEYWIADIKDANPCKDATPKVPMMPVDANEKCRIETVTKGDVAAYGKIFGGLVVRQKMYNGDALLMTVEVTSLSQAKLDDALFEIPKDYKKVSPEEFQKQQSAAMVKAMTSAQNQNGDNQNGDDAGDDNKKDDAMKN